MRVRLEEAVESGGDAGAVSARAESGRAAAATLAESAGEAMPVRVSGGMGGSAMGVCQFQSGYLPWAISRRGVAQPRKGNPYLRSR